MANLPTRNNNPGDLKDPSTGMFQKYDNPEAGFTALKNDLQGKISGNTKTGLNGDSTLQDFASTWAPDSDNNNSKQYAANLAKKLGVTTDTPISKLSGRLDDFASAIADNEGYQGNRVLGSETASTKLSPVDFAAKIKAKYPQYANVDDNTLTQKILAKYPQYSDLVGGGQTNAQTNNEQPNSGGFITSAKIPPPAPSASAPTDNTDKGFVGNLLSGNIGGAASDAVQGVGNALTFGGAKQLGDYFGTNIAQMTAGDNAKYVDPNGGDLGSGLAGAVKTGLGIAGVEGAGALLQKAIAPSEAILSNPLIKQAIPAFDKMTATEQTNALNDAINGASKNGKDVFNKALQVLTPKYMAENPDLYSFLERSPGIAKALGIAKSGGKFIFRAGLDIAGLDILAKLFK